MIFICSFIYLLVCRMFQPPYCWLERLEHWPAVLVQWPSIPYCWRYTCTISSKRCKHAVKDIYGPWRVRRTSAGPASAYCPRTINVIYGMFTALGEYKCTASNNGLRIGPTRTFGGTIWTKASQHGKEWDRTHTSMMTYLLLISPEPKVVGQDCLNQAMQGITTHLT